MIVQAPRTRKIGRSVPEIEQKWKVTVYIYVESAYEETLGCWCEARAEKERIVGPEDAVSGRADASES